MKAVTIVRLHRLVGLGMNARSVEELATDHLESHERRARLGVLGHAEFLVNNVWRRFATPPSADLGAHFLPALLVTGLGIAIYVAGGTGATPEASPTWPVIPVVVGIIWLVVETARASGFPTRRAVAPALMASFGALADALVMPVALPEDNSIRLGMAVFVVGCPLVFIRLATRSREGLPWDEVRDLLAVDRVLRVGWHILSLSLALIAVGEMFTLARLWLPGSFRIGAIVAGLGFAWMARSFHVAARLPKTC